MNGDSVTVPIQVPVSIVCEMLDSGLQVALEEYPEVAQSGEE
jgi:hypothetical protein